MLKYIVFSLILSFISALTAAQVPGQVPDLIKLKLSAEAARMADLPAGVYEQKPAFGVEELDKIMAQVGGTSVIRAHIRVLDKMWEQNNGFDRWFLIPLNGKTEPETAISAFAASPLVEFAQPEYLLYLSAMPNDPLLSVNWGFQNTVQFPAWSPPGSSSGSHSGTLVGQSGFDADIFEAWDRAQVYGSQDIVIAIIDSGVDLAHPDLSLVTGYDYGDNDPDPTDTHGHGTSVSGIAAAIAGNGAGTAGVAGNTKVMPLKVMDSSGVISYTSVANAVIHAADNGADLINLS
ncbi:MAG TPA: S8 family serine peptidase, partial [Candidatus Cloacimonadota bacterium]|nr:S8 family serine peptidase [Candidatus Cloacimonadota bacterium]